MPLITATNTNTVILTDIINWLSQIKVAGVPNERLGLGEIAAIGSDGFDINNMNLDQLCALTTEQLGDLTLSELDCTLNFYTDQAKTLLAFTDNTADGAQFATIGNKLFYTPPDSLINSAIGLSTTLNQPRYWVTATYTDGTIINAVYANNVNLMFESVIAANKPNPQFAQNLNQAIVVPMVERQDRKKVSGNIDFLTASFDIYLQLVNFDIKSLSEQQRLSARQHVTNAVRNALYIDRSRNGTCTFKDANLNGTYVAEMTPVKSDAVLKGIIKVQCAYMIHNSVY